MKIIRYILTSAILSILSIFSLKAQNTEGKEFWVTFGRNNNAPSNNYFVELQIRIVCGSHATTGSIYFTHLDETIDFSINPYQIYDHFLTNNQRQAVYNHVMGKTDYSIHITTSEQVTVYTLNHFPCCLDDVTNVLPVSALGSEYYHVSYTRNCIIGPDIIKDAYAVVATENNTLLYQNGDWVETLNKGQVYYYTSDTDMTGAHITSNKPLALFAVHQGAQIPSLANPNATSSNLMQQLAPVNTWGKTFFVPSTKFNKDIVRIVAARSGTYITQAGATLRTDVPGAQTTLTNLQAGHFVELYLSSNGCFIEASQPVAVCSYITHQQYSGLKTMPSQCWIPPVKQLVSCALIAPFVPTGMNFFLEHYALIVTPTATKENTKVSIGGASFSDLIGDTWSDNADAGMSFYSTPLSNPTASYIFTNPKGIIILGYALGGYTSQAASYYYLAYSAMRDLDAYFTANDIHFQDLKDNPICENLITFRAEIEGLAPPAVAERIKWFVDGEHQPLGFNQLTWQKSFTPGDYDVRMWVCYENGDTVSKTGTLKICSLDAGFYVNDVSHSVDTTFCNKKVYFRTEVETSTAQGSLRWFIDYGNGYIEEPAALDQKQWNKTFESGTYPIKMWVLFPNGENAEITSTLKIQTLWINIKNVRY